jgi:hypothetical protein
MDCVNHSGVGAAAYCQNCGKPLCAQCVAAGVLSHSTGGQILCDACFASWRQYYHPPFVPLHAHRPNPAAAAALGVIPGVGAMYNGQFFKGFIHVAVFAILVSIADHNDFFGIFVAAWVFYQCFEAYHTARALRDGQPVPDPLGLNDLAGRLNFGTQMRAEAQPGAAETPIPPDPQSQATGFSASPSTGESPPPYPPQYAPPYYRHHHAPVGAVVLIALGLIFLLGQLHIFHERIVKFAWPLMLIALGVWLIVRQFEETKGASK